MNDTELGFVCLFCAWKIRFSLLKERKSHFPHKFWFHVDKSTEKIPDLGKQKKLPYIHSLTSKHSRICSEYEKAFMRGCLSIFLIRVGNPIYRKEIYECTITNKPLFRSGEL